MFTGAFANRVALITGAGSGLGRQLALELSQQGAAIAAVDLQPEGLAALATTLAGRPVAVEVADVTDRAALGKAVAALQTRLGPIDLLIASAGVGIESSALDFRPEDFETVIRVNLIGVANSIAAVLPGMIERRRGQLVAISSLASCRGLPKLFGYCASKAGVNALLDGLRIELTGHGIGVTTICPGFIRTPMTARLEGRAVPLMEVDYAARCIVRAIERRRPFLAFPAQGRFWTSLLRLLPIGISDGIATWLSRQYAIRDAVSR